MMFHTRNVNFKRIQHKLGRKIANNKIIPLLGLTRTKKESKKKPEKVDDYGSSKFGSELLDPWKHSIPHTLVCSALDAASDQETYPALLQVT